MSDPLFLVTGANGFVGSHLTRTLLDRGVKVRAMVRDRDRADALADLDVELVEGDLREPASLRAGVEGVGGIYNIASLFREQDPSEDVFYDVNTEGVRRLFDAAIDAGVERLVHCSTVGVLGHVERPPANEETPVAPADKYQQTKLGGEQLAMDYFREGKIRGVVIRPAMIYGPEDTRTLKMFKMVAKGYWFYVGDGQTKVHFVDVRDLARSFVLAMEKTALNAEVYIIPGKESATQREMGDLIADELGVRKPWLHLPVKPMQWAGSMCEALCRPLKIEPPLYRRRVDFFTKHREFSAEKAARELDFEPAQSFEDEVRKLTRWYRDREWI